MLKKQQNIFQKRQAKGGLIMSLKIYTNRCKGCGICAAFCPKKVLAVNELEKIEAVAPENCIQCGQCELRCPDYAIFVHKEGDEK